MRVYQFRHIRRSGARDRSCLARIRRYYRARPVLSISGSCSRDRSGDRGGPRGTPTRSRRAAARAGQRSRARHCRARRRPDAHRAAHPRDTGPTTVDRRRATRSCGEHRSGRARRTGSMALPGRVERSRRHRAAGVDRNPVEPARSSERHASDRLRRDARLEPRIDRRCLALAPWPEQPWRGNQDRNH